MSANLENDDIVVNTKMLFNDGKPHTIKANKITFDGGAIIARGTPLTIEANELMVTGKPPLGGHHIQIFGVDGKDGKPGADGKPGGNGKSQGPAADGSNAHGVGSSRNDDHPNDGAAGADGSNGSNGGDGGDGSSSEPFTLSLSNVAPYSAGLLFYNMSGRGGNGGAGGNGGNGGDGGNGKNGTHGRGFWCYGGNGGKGGDGGNGGNGGDGGNGVHGLPISITFPAVAKNLLTVQQDKTPYGKGGSGGAGGQYGAGGKGAEACETIVPDGKDGTHGTLGNKGKDGQNSTVVGLPGEITYHWIDNKPVDDN